MQSTFQIFYALGFFGAAFAGQILGASSLPKTNAFRDIRWTVFSLACFTRPQVF